MRILQNVYLTSEEYIFQPMKVVVACSTWMINLKFICSFSVTIVGWKCSFWCFDWCICIQMEEENGFSVLIFLLQYSQPETSLDICSTNVCFKCTHFLQFSMETNKKTSNAKIPNEMAWIIREIIAMSCTDSNDWCPVNAFNEPWKERHGKFVSLWQNSSNT